jgi:hypothetical protein
MISEERLEMRSLLTPAAVHSVLNIAVWLCLCFGLFSDNGLSRCQGVNWRNPNVNKVPGSL